MRGRLSSYRFRRRLFWTLGSLAVVTAVVAGAVAIGNTGHRNATPPIDGPAQFYTTPPATELTREDRLRLYRLSAQFVKTAVARKHLDSAWEMLGPEMRAGQTRRSWDTGFNNVVPFSADGIEHFSVLYSYEGDVALDLSLFSGRGSGWAGKTFTIELKRYPNHGNHWLVAAWVPKGIGGGGTLSSRRRAGPPLPPVHAKLSSKFLFVPLAFLAVLLGTLLVVGGRSIIQQRRYAKALGYSSSSKPS